PDILAVQEACDWEKSGRFIEIAELLKFPVEQSRLFPANPRSSSGRVYDIAFYSRYPIKKQTTYSDPSIIWHTMPHLALDYLETTHIIVAHLNPKTEDARLIEAENINKILRENNKQPVIVLGDFNSLSPDDNYSADLDDKLEKNKITKFGNPSRHDVITSLFKNDWHDTMADQARNNDQVNITVAESSEDQDHLDLRLDYIMVNDELKSKINKTYIIDNQLTRQASDHLPIVTEISS
ncbi:endonuclease/exonuclease/phosphatase family protein, partial [Patescibacteria group bacterium]